MQPLLAVHNGTMSFCLNEEVSLGVQLDYCGYVLAFVAFAQSSHYQVEPIRGAAAHLLGDQERETASGAVAQLLVLHLVAAAVAVTVVVALQGPVQLVVLL